MKKYYFIALLLQSMQAQAQNVDWPKYLGGLDSSQYSPLTQINPDTVGGLEVAWIYHSENKNPERLGQIQCNPLVIGGILYGVSPSMKVFALDAATGKEIWTFIPENRKKIVTRGFAWWQDGDEKRLLYTAGSYLYSLDPETGAQDMAFGKNGRVDLRDGLGREITSIRVDAKSPGVVYQDLYILGFSSNDVLPSAPGHIRAFNVRTGAIEWIFHTIPQPGEFGYKTWPKEAYTYSGGANNWTGMSLDTKRGIVYIPTGSAAADFNGANRLGDNLFANSLIALDAATGKRKWHFQTTHHDMWDRDLPAPPNLMTVEHDGQRIDAVAQITKSAHIFLFNRETGEPLFFIEEKTVQPSELVGEQASPTQPIPIKPLSFSRTDVTKDDLTDISPEAHEAALRVWEASRKGDIYIPPSLEGTIMMPGYDGGGEWGGASVDPKTGILYVNASEMPFILTMVDVTKLGGDKNFSEGKEIYGEQCLQCHGVGRELQPALKNVSDRLTRDEAHSTILTGRGFMPSFDFLGEEKINAVVNYLFQPSTVSLDDSKITDAEPVNQKPKYRATGYIPFLDSSGYPAIKPPWGTLNAINMNTGEIIWKSVLGDTPELRKKGLPQTGTENYGGPVATAGGVLFIGATKDEMFHVYNSKTGKLLWEAKLPAGGYATPSTYMVGGKQYIVIAAAGGKMGTTEGDAYVAFRLKD